MRVRPSEILKEDIINYLGWTVEEAAEQLKVPLSELVAVLNDQKPITSDFARKLEEAGHGTVGGWLRLEAKAPLMRYGLDKVPYGRDIMDARNIPEPFQTRFRNAMRGATVPTASMHKFYTSDWLSWASTSWYWDEKHLSTEDKTRP